MLAVAGTVGGELAKLLIVDEDVECGVWIEGLDREREFVNERTAVVAVD